MIAYFCSRPVRQFGFMGLVLFAAFAQADNTSTSTPDSHAPIGVMGDHTHKKGEWMVSYRMMNMRMQGNLQGSDSISVEQIVTTVPNRFANPPMMPPTLRVVPEKMTMQMYMLGMMYAPSDDITLMAMLNYLDNSMDLTTFKGGMGTERLGQFSTDSAGMGDTRIGLLWSLVKSSQHKIHANLGLSIPTGSITETAQILTPMGQTPSPRSPYPMQLGSGTWDMEPGITYSGSEALLGWGVQAKYLHRISDNDEGYTLGNKTTLTGWSSYRFMPWLSASLRLTYTDTDPIDGMDVAIMLPVQTADPDNMGGKRWELGAGVNFLSASGHRLALEYQQPFHQDVNGVQMEMGSSFTLGYQYAF